MGTPFGKYEVQGELGHGAFGRVYRAFDPVTRRPVAIKVLITENDPDALARFFVEVQATAKLKHKNIVTIYDFNEKPPYIVMELVEGESLQQIIPRHAQFSLLQKVRILLQAAEGFASAHKGGIVHRDIKPANIMVLPSGDVKIMDFGIARVTGDTEARRTRQGDLIGTILYMSPERIQGAEADACADIFSFGVVGCELITGNHPFQGRDYAAVIYKITSEDLPPIHKVVPECPEVLEMVIQRATAKDREVRYQSMDELLFDLKPVLLELEHREAASIMQEVRDLIGEGRVVEAQAKVRCVLELDPTNREARQVHDALVKEQRRQLVQAKVDKLIQEGTTHLAQRQFNRAIQDFESALHLDPDTQIGNLLGQARTALEANRSASRLVSEAHREMLARNLDAAYQNATRAFEADPRHQDAAALRDKLRQQIEMRDRKSRVEKAFHRAEELLSQSSFNTARAALAEIEEEADPVVIRELRLRISIEEAEWVRRAREQRVQRSIEAATRQMRSNLLAEAEETLRELLEEFPDATGASQLLLIVREHVEAQGRAEAITKLTQQTKNLLDKQSFQEAVTTLEGGLQRFPGDATLQRLLDRTLDLQRRFERTQAITLIVGELQQLRADGKTQDALARVGNALAQYGDDDALIDLKSKLESEHKQQLYTGGVREAIAAGEALINEGMFADAIAALERSATRYSDEPELISLLTRARRSLADQEEQQCVTRTLTQVDEFRKREEWQAALECVEAALLSYPDNAVLSELIEKTGENWRKQQRRYNVDRRTAVIQHSLDTGSLTRAADELRAAKEDFPGESCFAPIEERIRQAQVQAQLLSLEQEVTQCLASGDLEKAARQLNEAQPWADPSRWLALKQELLHHQEYHRTLQKAQQLKDAKEYQAAEDLLRPLLRTNPPDQRAAGLLQAICTERQSLERERAYGRALEEAERFYVERNFDRAQQILQQILENALDQRALDLLKAVIAERTILEEQQRLEQGKKDIQDLLDRSDLQNAFALIDRFERDFPEDPEWGALRTAAGRKSDTEKAINQAGELEQRLQFEAALRVVENALQADPDNAGLVNTSKRLRQAVFNRLVQNVRSSFANNDLRRAESLLEGAKDRWGNEARWDSLHEELAQRHAQVAALREAELARKEVERAIREGRQRAGALKSKGDLKEALKLLDGLCGQHPDHSELCRDRQAVLRMIEIDFVSQALSRITSMQIQQNWDAALEEAERTLASYPENSELAAAAKEERRRKETRRCVGEIESAIAVHEWSVALQKLEAAEARFPGGVAFERLREDLQKSRLQHQLNELITSAQHALLTGDLDDAARLIANCRTELSGEREWNDLNEQLELHRRYVDTLSTAENLRVAGKYERAEELLRRALSSAPDSRAATLLRSVTAGRLQKEKDDAIAAARQEIERLLTESMLQDALGVLDRICRNYPEDFQLADERKSLEARAEKQRTETRRQELERQQAAVRARKLASCRAAVDTAVQAHDWDQALRTIELAEPELPDDPAFAELRQQVTRLKHQAGLEELATQVRQSFSRNDLGAASRHLAAGRADFSNESLWQSLNQELSRRQQYEKLLADAQDLIIDARYAAAQKKLQEAVALDSEDRRANVLLKDIADDRNARLRLKTQFRLIARKYRPVIKLAGIAAGVLLAAGIGLFIRRLQAPPPAITLHYQPPQLNLLYQMGTSSLPRGVIEFQPAPVDFQVWTGADWLTVAPSTGKGLGRLRITVTKAPSAGTYATTLLIRAKGRPVTNDPVSIPVRLDVTEAEPPTSVPLTLETEAVTFEYTQGESGPGTKTVKAIHGEIASTRQLQHWYRLDHTRKQVTISVLPQTVGQYSDTATVESPGPGRAATIEVKLRVNPAKAPPKQVSPPLGEGAKPVPSPLPPVEKEQKPLPQATGCDTHAWGGDPDGYFTWVGSLGPGQTVVIQRDLAPGDGRIQSGKVPPNRQVLKISHIDPPGIDSYVPTNDNRCRPLTLKNTTTSTITKFTVRWQVPKTR